MNARRFDGLLIDFYGTISKGDRDVVDSVCGKVVAACGLDLDAEQMAECWGRQFFALLDRSNHQDFLTLCECESASLRTTIASLGAGEIDVEPFVAELEEYWADPPIHADAAEFLREVDLPTCCVSNADTEPLMAAIAKHGLRFDAVITSQSARCYKPAPAIFEKALATLEIEPQRAMHIGDSLHSDVGGAKNLGITTTWVRRANRIHDIGSCQPDHVVSCLTDMSPLTL